MSESIVQYRFVRDGVTEYYEIILSIERELVKGSEDYDETMKKWLGQVLELIRIDEEKNDDEAKILTGWQGINEEA